MLFNLLISSLSDHLNNMLRFWIALDLQFKVYFSLLKALSHHLTLDLCSSVGLISLNFQNWFYKMISLSRYN